MSHYSLTEYTYPYTQQTLHKPGMLYNGSITCLYTLYQLHRYINRIPEETKILGKITNPFQKGKYSPFTFV